MFSNRSLRRQDLQVDFSTHQTRHIIIILRERRVRLIILVAHHILVMLMDITVQGSSRHTQRQMVTIQMHILIAALQEVDSICNAVTIQWVS